MLPFSGRIYSLDYQLQSEFFIVQKYLENCGTLKVQYKKYSMDCLLHFPLPLPLEIHSSPISAVNEPHVTINVSKLQETSNGCLFLALWLDGWFLYWQTHQKQDMCVAMHGTALPLGLVVVVAEPQIYFTKGLWAHNPNLANKSCCSYLENDIQIRSLFCTSKQQCCHDIYQFVSYRKISNIRCTQSQNLNVSHLGLQMLYWSPVLSGEWRCSWSSTDRRCSNCIWVINNLIAN